MSVPPSRNGRSWQTLMRESRVDGASNKARKGGGVMGDTKNPNKTSASAPEDVRLLSTIAMPE